MFFLFLEKVTIESQLSCGKKFLLEILTESLLIAQLDVYPYPHLLQEAFCNFWKVFKSPWNYLLNRSKRPCPKLGIRIEFFKKFYQACHLT